MFATTIFRDGGGAGVGGGMFHIQLSMKWPSHKSFGSLSFTC